MAKKLEVNLQLVFTGEASSSAVRGSVDAGNVEELTELLNVGRFIAVYNEGGKVKTLVNPSHITKVEFRAVKSKAAKGTQ